MTQAAERETYFLFTPTLNMPRYAMHHWRLRGTTVVDVLNIEEWSVSQFAWVTGRAEPVPPKALIDRVDALVKDGAEVNAPFGWRVPFAAFHGDGIQKAD